MIDLEKEYQNAALLYKKDQLLKKRALAIADDQPSVDKSPKNLS